jgi:3-oxoacyl-[acyl-carrier protein] reductase
MLEGKKIVVTGAGRGIGRAIALACLRAGAGVGLHYRTSEAGARSIQEEFPDRSLLLPFDVRDAGAVEAAVARFRDWGGRIDGWVNNAGVNRPGLLVSGSLEEIREQIETNLLGPTLCARAVLPAMMEQRGGVLLNVSSVAAVRPSQGQAVYAATKGGLEALTRALAREYGRKGIRVHGLRPGPIDTSMIEGTMAMAEDEVLSRIPLRRLGRPEEVGDFAAYLLSDRASFISGSIHTIDGGYLEG